MSSEPELNKRAQAMAMRNASTYARYAVHTQARNAGNPHHDLEGLWTTA